MQSFSLDSEKTSTSNEDQENIGPAFMLGTHFVANSNYALRSGFGFGNTTPVNTQLEASSDSSDSISQTQIPSDLPLEHNEMNTGTGYPFGNELADASSPPDDFIIFI